MKHLLLSSTILLAASTGLMAQEVEVGDPQSGLAYAKEACSTCHGISNEKSPIVAATAFNEIANVPGMSTKALLVWMQTLHPTMPNITPERKDLADVIAYILSLRTEVKERELMAEEAQGGDPQAGLAYAKEVCANCHAISNETSTVPAAPTFNEIANVQGMSAKALLVWMRVLHPTMPNITLEREDLLDVIAYILGHKDKDRSDNQ